MSKQLIGIIIAILLVAGGAFAYFAVNDSGEESASQDSQDTSSEIAEEDNGATPFDPVSLENSSYIATVSGEDESGPVEGTIESDGEGNYRFAFTVDGESSEMITVDSTTYSCTDSEGCFSFPQSEDTSGMQDAFNPDRFNYNDEDYQEFQDLASYQGQQTCSVGTCDVWVYSDEDVDSTIFIEPGSNRIIRIESREGNSTFTLAYEYREVSIEAPDNPQTIDLPSFE